MIDAATISACAAVIAAVAGPFVAWMLGQRTIQQIAIVEEKIDGPLKALVASIHAEASLKIAVAEAAASRAFGRGQESERADPLATRADVLKAVAGVAPTGTGITK